MRTVSSFPSSSGFHIDVDGNNENKLFTIPDILTKCLILAQINGIYDPLGLVTPVTVKGKIMMKDLWTKLKIGWDDALSEEVRNQWINFFKSLSSPDGIFI